MTGPFSGKISGFSRNLKALWKIKQLSANAMEAGLGVTWALSQYWLAEHAHLKGKTLPTSVTAFAKKFEPRSGPTKCWFCVIWIQTV